ncbi:MAG: Fic family protein [Clostridiales bacterium]|nr:Fic family protein [Clostridiales bacterium]
MDNEKVEKEAIESEEKTLKLRAKELFDKGLLKEYEVGTFKGLASIHEYLYKDITDQAGKKRTVDIVKGNMRFTPVNALDTGVEFADIMPFDTFDEIVDKYIEMNIAHPFRTGNSIALRIWLNEMLREKIGEVVDFSTIEKEKFTVALEKSHTDDEKLYKLLKDALKADLGRDMYLKGIDASFSFEGFSDYSVFKL